MKNKKQTAKKETKMTENEKILKANGYRRAYIEYPIYSRDAGGRSVFIRLFGRRARLSTGIVLM